MGARSSVILVGQAVIQSGAAASQLCGRAVAVVLRPRSPLPSGCMLCRQGIEPFQASWLPACNTPLPPPPSPPPTHTRHAAVYNNELRTSRGKAHRRGAARPGRGARRSRTRVHPSQRGAIPGCPCAAPVAFNPAGCHAMLNNLLCAIHEASQLHPPPRHPGIAPTGRSSRTVRCAGLCCRPVPPGPKGCRWCGRRSLASAARAACWARPPAWAAHAGPTPAGGGGRGGAGRCKGPSVHVCSRAVD